MAAQPGVKKALAQVDQWQTCAGSSTALPEPTHVADYLTRCGLDHLDGSGKVTGLRLTPLHLKTPWGRTMIALWQS